MSRARLGSEDQPGASAVPATQLRCSIRPPPQATATSWASSGAASHIGWCITSTCRWCKGPCQDARTCMHSSSISSRIECMWGIKHWQCRTAPDDVASATDGPCPHVSQSKQPRTPDTCGQSCTDLQTARGIWRETSVRPSSHKSEPCTMKLHMRCYGQQSIACQLCQLWA